MKRKILSALGLLALCAALLLGYRTWTAWPGRMWPAGFETSSVPAFQERVWVEINGNAPFFQAQEKTTRAFARYSALDALGRCGPAYACAGRELMPTEPRGNIGMVRPSGWHTVRYDDLVDGKYLYNRCHLLGYQLTGENDNEQNLITGTRYFNTQGMLPFENQVADYIRSTGNHVLYRVTPVFEDADLLARGVLMEALSVEDNGAGLRFCVFVYNVQPHIVLDYATGDSARAEEETEAAAPTPSVPPSAQPAAQPSADADPVQADYIVNKSSKRFHLPSCSGAADIKAENKLAYTGSRESLLAQGYVPCGQCGP